MTADAVGRPASLMNKFGLRYRPFGLRLAAAQRMHADGFMPDESGGDPVKRLFAPMLLAATAGVVVTLVALCSRSAAGARAAGSAPRLRVGRREHAAGTRREVASTALSATQIYQRDSSGVVAIKAVTSEGEDSGTGIVLNDSGLILTNDHVVAGASSLTVGPRHLAQRDPHGDARRGGSQQRPRADPHRSRRG